MGQGVKRAPVAIVVVLLGCGGGHTESGVDAGDDAGPGDDGGVPCGADAEIAAGGSFTADSCDETDRSSGCEGAGSRDVLATFTPDADGRYRFDTSGTPYDTILGVGGECGTTDLACNDDFPDLEEDTSAVVLDLEAGHTYFLAVEAYEAADCGPTRISVTGPLDPDCGTDGADCGGNDDCCSGFCDGYCEDPVQDP